MATAPQRFSEFLVFLETILTDEMRSIMPLVIKRYDACSRPFKNSQDMLLLLTKTKRDMEGDQRHMFIYLKDFLSALSARQQQEKLATAKRKRESDSSDEGALSGKESEKSENKRTKTNSMITDKESANSGEESGKPSDKRTMINATVKESADTGKDMEKPGSKMIKTNSIAEVKKSAYYAESAPLASSADCTTASKPVEHNGWTGFKGVSQDNEASGADGQKGEDQRTNHTSHFDEIYVCLSSSDEDTTHSKNNKLNSEMSSTSKSSGVYQQSEQQQSDSEQQQSDSEQQQSDSEQLPSISTPSKCVQGGKISHNVLDGATSQVHLVGKTSQVLFELEGKTPLVVLDKKADTALLMKNSSDVCSTSKPVDNQDVNSLPEPATSVSKQKEVSEKHIHKLEKLLAKLRNEIERTREKELTLDDLDAEDSSYLYEDRLEKKFVAVWEKLCQAKKRKPSTGRPTERHFTYNGSRYPEVNKQIERLINKKKIFPDYFDIRKIFCKVNEEKSLGLSTSACASLSRETFIEVGNFLQKRRQEDFVYTFRSKQTEDFRIDKDPALFDKELKKKLEENGKKGKDKLAEVINKYAHMQYNIPDMENKESSDEQMSQLSDECNDERIGTDKNCLISSHKQPIKLQPRKVCVESTICLSLSDGDTNAALNRNVGDQNEEGSSTSPTLPDADKQREVTCVKAAAPLTFSGEEIAAVDREMTCDAVKPREVTCAQSETNLSISDDEDPVNKLDLNSDISAKVDNEENNFLTIQPRSTNPLIWSQPKRVNSGLAEFNENKDEASMINRKVKMFNKNKSDVDVVRSEVEAVDVEKRGGTTHGITVNSKTSSSSDVVFVDITDDESDITLMSVINRDRSDECVANNIADSACKDKETNIIINTNVDCKTSENLVDEKLANETDVEIIDDCIAISFRPSVDSEIPKKSGFTSSAVDTCTSDTETIVEIKDDDNDSVNNGDVGGQVGDAGGQDGDTGGQDGDDISEILKDNSDTNSWFGKRDKNVDITDDINKTSTMQTTLSVREPEKHNSGSLNTNQTNTLRADVAFSGRPVCHSSASSNKGKDTSSLSSLSSPSLSSRIVTLMDKQIELHIPDSLLKKNTKKESKNNIKIGSHCVKNEPPHNSVLSVTSISSPTCAHRTKVDEVTSSNIPADDDVDDVILLSSGNFEDSDDDDDVIILSD